MASGGTFLRDECRNLVDRPAHVREGQGIVASGVLDAGHTLRADEVLAKHDENYMPPEVAEAMEIAKRGGEDAC